MLQAKLIIISSGKKSGEGKAKRIGSTGRKQYEKKLLVAEKPLIMFARNLIMYLLHQ